MSKKAKGAVNNRSIKQFLKCTTPPSVIQSAENQPLPATAPTEKRKIVGNLESFIIKKPVNKAPVPTVILYSARDLIGKMNPDQLFQQIPSLKAFAESLQERTMHKNSVRRLIFSFLSNRKNQLWSLKYAPSDLGGVFPADTVDRIRRWLKQFSCSVSQIDLSDAQFICDSENPHEENRRNRLKNCNQKALILYGRSGIGKMTLLKCIAQTMGMEPHVCSNQQDRFKYLKEKDESTKSQCVKSRKRCPTPSVLLTSFFSKKDDQSNSQPQPQSVQIIHQINLIYPSDKKTKFHQDLIRLMQQSMVPFIFTSSIQSIPTEYKQFEKVQFKELSKRQMAELFWLVYHIEWCMNELSSNQGIEKEQLFPTLNRQLAQLKFQQVLQIKHLEDIVQILDYKFDPVFNLLHYHFTLRTRNPELIKRDALTNVIYAARSASAEKIVQDIPSQHYTNNLTEIYTFDQPVEETLEGRLDILKTMITRDEFDNAGDQKTMNSFYRRNWLSNLQPELVEIDVKQHYSIPQHKSLKTKLANHINSSIITSSQVYSTFGPMDFALMRPERSRNQRRQTRQLLEEIVGTDHARYLTYFSRLS